HHPRAAGATRPPASSTASLPSVCRPRPTVGWPRRSPCSVPPRWRAARHRHRPSRVHPGASPERTSPPRCYPPRTARPRRRSLPLPLVLPHLRVRVVAVEAVCLDPCHHATTADPRPPNAAVALRRPRDDRCSPGLANQQRPRHYQGNHPGQHPHDDVHQPPTALQIATDRPIHAVTNIIPPPTAMNQPQRSPRTVTTPLATCPVTPRVDKRREERHQHHRAYACQGYTDHHNALPSSSCSG